MLNIKKIKRFIDKNLKWLVLIGAIGGLMLFIKSHGQDIRTQIFSLLVIVLAIYYFMTLEKKSFFSVKKKISKRLVTAFNTLNSLFQRIKPYLNKYKLFIIPISGIIIIFLSYFCAYHYYQKKYPERDLNENLVLSLDFEEGQGDTLYDKSPQKNNGEIHGNPKWTIGKKGLALEFDGKDDYVNLGKWQQPFTDKNYTIAIWLYIEEFPKNNTCDYIFWRDDDAPSIRFNENGTELRFHVDGNYGQAIRLTTKPISYINKWNHLAITYNGITEKIYINGQLQGKKEVTMDNYLDPQPLHLAWDGVEKRALKGKLDEVKIYDKTLRNEEIKILRLGKGKAFLFSSLFNNLSLVSLVILIVIISYLEFLMKKKKDNEI